MESKQTEKVQRIIALKRFEQPPPGYFHLLPDRIINRLEKGEGRAKFWEKWLAGFTVRPALAYAFGLTVCGVVTLGMFYQPNTGNGAQVSPSASDALWAAAAAEAAAADESDPSRGLPIAPWLGSTNPAYAPSSVASGFETAEVQTVPVAFYTSGEQ